MSMKGQAHKFGDDVNTDYIIAGKYKYKIKNMAELARHVFEELRPGFYKEVSEGDFVVAGDNFGCGSSREQAPLVIQEAGISAVLVRSCARIFYRNAINIGLPVLECDTTAIEEGDVLEIDPLAGVIKNVTQDITIPAQPLSPTMMTILCDGGLAEHLRKHGRFAFEE
ncbi:MAG: 3-isopropylmalate dehydratase small subunit [Chloroflexota bacterium]|nr:3-isopropylmalate dehydratase small subunit [Chloroflexota bacterium]